MRHTKWREILQDKRVVHTLFLVVVALLYFDSHAYEQFSRRPGSIHQWRQSDGASMALIYFQDGNALWEPKMHNLLGGEGRAGGEFPLLYYLAGQSYHIFGFHESILRGLHLFLFLLGVFLLFKEVLCIYQVKLLSNVPFLLFLSTPTLLFYSPSFLPDTPAMGLALAGLAMVIAHYRMGKSTALVWATAFFMICALLKVSMLLFFFSFLAMEGVGKVLRIEHEGMASIGGIAWKRLAGMLIVVLMPSVLWYRYIQGYNTEHEGLYFRTNTTPIWSMPSEEVWASINATINDWSQVLYAQFVLVLLLFVFATFVISAVRKWSHWHLLAVSFTLGSIAYVSLFFNTFLYHDYYFIVLMGNTLLWSIASVHWIDQHVKSLNNTPFAILVAALLLVAYGAIHTTNKLFKGTYLAWYDSMSLNPNLNDLEPWLDAHDITYTDTLIVLPDYSPNRALYLMNRKGWSGLTGIYNTDDGDRYIEQGAQYAVVTDTSFYSIMFLHYHITDTIGYHGDVGIYRIEKSR